MMNFPINQGFKFKAILNNEDRVFEVLEYDGEQYAIRWDDGDEEWAYATDMERWTDEWKVKYIFKQLKL